MEQHNIDQVFFLSIQDGAHVSVYDPVFTGEDLSLFGELQIRVLAENRAGVHHGVLSGAGNTDHSFDSPHRTANMC